IMAASAIAISSDSSDESMGSLPSQVILFGDIPTVIPSTSVIAPETSTIAHVISSAAPVVETTLVASPTGLCSLVPYSDSDFDSPDEMSKVASRPSSSFDFPIAPVTAPPRTRRRAAILIRPGEAIPFGRPYCTHLNGLRKLLTARKRVGTIPTRGLAWRRVSPRASDHHSSSSSSSSDSSPIHSSGLDAPDQAHFGSSTRDVSPRLGYPPRREPRRNSSERPLHSSSHSAGPSRKRCKSPVDSVPSSTLVIGSLAPTRAGLLPPRKRFRDSYSSKARIEEDTEIDPRDVRDDTEEYEADTSVGDTVKVVIDPMLASIVEDEIVEPAGEGSSDSSSTRDDIVRSFEDMPIDLDEVVCDFYHHMSKVCIDRIVGIEIVKRRLKADQLIARGERPGMIERIESLRLENLKEEFRQVRRDHDDTRGRLRRLKSTMTNTRSGMTPTAIKELINQRMDAALEAHRVNRDLRLRNRNDNGGGDGNGNCTGNGNNRGDNGDDNENHNGNGRGDRPGARECTYENFMKCQPLSFKRTEGVVKYATWTLLDSALTWWNSHKRTIETDAAYALSWRELLKLMTEVYCPRNEIQKMETELWNLSVKNNDMATYT
ncbi:putative reverse transcriptase domain-containing protein, partial [Tanacetum coccineum]